MASSKSLGVLSLDLVARVGGFEKGMDSAARSADKARKKIDTSAKGIAKELKAAFAFVGVAALFGAIVRNTTEAEDALNQLQARIKSTGNVAGQSIPDLQAFASQLQGVTTFGDDAILAMQGVLLSFTNIRGGTVKDATRAILDLSTAMGTDLQSAAVLVGKALNDPVKGATALGRAGVQLTEEQKKLIKSLVDVGDVAAAQTIILKELETQFGGSAEAAGNTFAGAIKQVSNAFGDLLEAPGGGLNDVTGSLKDLTALLRDPGTIQAAQALTGALITGFKLVAEAITGTVNATRSFAEDLAANFNGPASDDIDRLTDRLVELVKARDAFITDRVEFFGPNGMVQFWDDKELKTEIARLQKLIFEATANQPPLITAKPGPVVPGKGSPAPRLPADISEIKIIIPKIEMTEMQKFFADLRQDTSTQEDIALQSYYKQKLALDTLWSAAQAGADGARLSAEEYNARLTEIQDELLPEFEVTAKKVKEVAEKQVTELNEFQKQAARNTQDIIADTLTSGFEGGFKGIVKSFADMLIQLSAQAVAANIASKIFGEAGGGTTGTTGWLGMLSGLFTARAGGGPVSAGVPYLVGERGPEIVVPRGNGTVIPNGAGMRTQMVNVNFTLPGGGEISRKTQEQGAAMVAQGLARANRRNN